jgi:hypothetical protein
MDELTRKSDNFDITMTKVGLNFDKEIYLLRAFEEDQIAKKKYLRTAGILVGDELLTSTFADTTHCMEELNLFDFGNSQNKYFAVTEYQSTKNLKLIIDEKNKKYIFISKSEAKTMYKLFNMSLIGYSLARVLEFEYRFTPQSISTALHRHDYLTLPSQEK